MNYYINAENVGRTTGYNNESTLLCIKLSTSPLYGPFIVRTMSYAARLTVLHYG